MLSHPTHQPLLWFLINSQGLTYLTRLTSFSEMFIALTNAAARSGGEAVGSQCEVWAEGDDGEAVGEPGGDR